MPVTLLLPARRGDLVHVVRRSTPACRRSHGNLSKIFLTMATPEETLEELLDKVSIAREELVAIERTLERLKDDVAKAQKQNNGSPKTR